MLKSILYACTFSSLVFLSAFAEETTNGINNQSVEIISTENIQDDFAEQITGCGCKNKNKNKNLQACCGNEDHKTSEESSLPVACSLCGGGKHLVVVSPEGLTEGEAAVVKTAEEETQAA